MLVHANGDAAIDLMLDAIDKAVGGQPDPNWSITLIHGQFVRKDQLDRLKKYGVTPSFYTLHTFYFADAHVKNRGKEQAAYISPMRDAIDKGLRPTNHTDFVVAPLDQMMVMWSAVNRISRGGAVIGADQRVTPLEALKAQTINAAWQYGEQDSKGSLEPGKRADLVILDRNPIKVAPLEIKDISVLETVKDGHTIYQRS
jgi:predicted amidohydrolase YtcJ